MEKTGKTIAGQLVDRLPNEIGQFVGVLADGRDLHCSGPVEVEVTHHIRQKLHLVWFETSCVLKVSKLSTRVLDR